MALNAYLVLKGQKQGAVKGSVTLKGREGQIAVYAVTHNLSSPRDSASGQATGKRVHKPLTVTKEIDVSTPPLYKALVDNEAISAFSLLFWAPGPQGKEVQYYTIKLTNAFIADIKTTMLNNKESDNANMPVLEEVSFVYQKIEWIIQGGQTTTDTWMQAV